MGRKGLGRRLPRRTCFLCGNRSSKRDLVRIVRTPENEVVVDRTGKMLGRGAYLCKAQICWQKGLKGNKLDNVLKAAVSIQEKITLVDYPVNNPDFSSVGRKT